MKHLHHRSLSRRNSLVSDLNFNGADVRFFIKFYWKLRAMMGKFCSNSYRLCQSSVSSGYDGKDTIYAHISGSVLF